MLINNHSFFSLRYGTLSIQQLVGSAITNGFKKLVITDINNSTGVIDFVKEAKLKGLEPAAGIEFRSNKNFYFIAIAKNNEGFKEINNFLTDCNMGRKALLPEAPKFSQAFVVYDFAKLKNIQSLGQNEYIGIRPHEVFKMGSVPKSMHHKLVALHPVTFADFNGYELHRHLRAIDINVVLTKLQPRDLAHEYEIFPTASELENSYRGFEFLLYNAQNLIGQCSIDFNFKSIKNKKTFTTTVDDDQNLLRKLAYEGMNYRYGKNHPVARERVEKELDIIFKLGFSAYFLITWDMVRYSMSKGYYHVGRGSGANSVVAYCLKIVDVDPIELDLYFERFINPRRTSPPDFDIDYSWKERDDVQRYLFSRYGEGHVALLGAMSTFVGKSIYRELGKVYGLPKEEIDDLIKYPEHERNINNITLKIHKLASSLAGFPNMRSIHAGGILVSEEPITSFVALDMPPKGFPTTQWDMYMAEDIGYEKLDVLSQRGIGHIRDAVEYIRENKNIVVDYHRVADFKRDPVVRQMLEKGKTVGCFYIESPAMRGLIRKLNCNNYLTLVAASSIIRPGVSSSGMMREYIVRYHNPSGFKYLHPVMKEQLQETYGVMVYQEDVLKVCHHYAGLDLGDADVLRRAMSGKTRSQDEFNRIVSRFFEGSEKLGRPKETTEEVWRQIRSFAGYSFSKAHSASYAVESYQSLFLKAHFPLEFITAVINNFGGYYRTWLYFNEARMLGAKIMLPDVNTSNYLSRIIEDRIYVGFVHIMDFERTLAMDIVKSRDDFGEYDGLEDFTERVKIGLEQLLILIRTGAFNFTGKTKAVLHWEAHVLINRGMVKKQVNGPVLFGGMARKFTLPELQTDTVMDSYDEIELLGFPVSSSYFDLLQTGFRGEVKADALVNCIGKMVRMIGHLVTIKYVKTKRGDYMHFGTFVDDTGNLFDTVHFADSLKQYPFRGDGIYLLLGKVVEEFGYASLEVQKMAKMPLRPNPISR